MALVQEVDKPEITTVMVSDTLAFPSVLKKEGKVEYGELRETLKEFIENTYIKEFGLRDVNLFILPGAKGTYRKWVAKNVAEFVTLIGSSGDLKFAALWYLIQELEKNLEKLVEDKQLEIIFDVSHGWNFVPTVLYRVLFLLSEILSFFGIDTYIRLIATEPFVDSNTPLNVVEIERKPIPYNLYPYTTGEQGYKSSLKLYDKKFGKEAGILLGELKNYINAHKEVRVNDIPLLVGAFYNGFPLAVKEYYISPERLKPFVEKVFELYLKGIDVFVEGEESENVKGRTNIVRKLKLHPFVEVLLVSYLYSLLTKAKAEGDFLEKGEITIDKLREFSCQIFGRDEKKLIHIERELGNCEGTFKGDIERTIEEAINLGVNLSEWKRLKDVEDEIREKLEPKLSTEREKSPQEEDTGDSRRGSIDKRNFFAHAGLSKSEVEVKVENGEIYIRYWQNEDSLKRIQGWILKSLIELRDE